MRSEQRVMRRNQTKLKHGGSKMKKQQGGATATSNTVVINGANSGDSPCINNNNNTINCLPSQQQLLPPARSSLKIPHNNSVTLSHAATHPACDPMTPASPLSRCCSLESPKKLRFATQSNYYQGIPSDSEVFPCTEPLCNGDHNQSCNCPVSEDLEEEDTGLVLKFNNNNNNNQHHHYQHIKYHTPTQ
uniref:Uncharacterized protein n=1 Tax=Cacopsylla melanoneura TaxID=428564 RepID=A0A8D8SIH2_9HEMI